jgi:transposase-like protein
MREMSVTEQRYKAVQGVLADGRTVGEVASQWEVSRRTLHRWLARYEAGGLEGLGDGSHRPAHCPHQMPAAVEVLVLEMRRAHAYWGARRIASCDVLVTEGLLQFWVGSELLKTVARTGKGTVRKVSVGVRQINRSSLTTHQPEAHRGTIPPTPPYVAHPIGAGS